MYFIRSGHLGFNLENVEVWRDVEQKGTLFVSVGSRVLVLAGEVREICLAWLVAASYGRTLEGGEIQVHAGETFPRG